MSQITFDTPVLKIEGLQAKFDVVPASSSLAVLLGNINRALIVQQLHYWGLQGYGVVIEGVRWFYKPIKEWIDDVFPTFTPWQLRKLMAELVELGVVRRAKLFTKHQIQNGDRFWWQPKNQTYYYSLSTEKLQELVREFFSQEMAETPETSVLCKTTKLSFVEKQNTKVCDCSQNKTKNTSIENISTDQSHPSLPCVSNNQSQNSQEKQYSDNLQQPQISFTDSVNPKAIARAAKPLSVEQKINKNNCTNEAFVQESVRVEMADTEEIALAKPVEKPVAKPRIKTPKGTKSVSKRIESAPWKDEGQFKRFYRALIQALPIVANARSPQGLAQVIIRQLRSGIPHTYWDDFVAGLPIGTSTKPEWEVEPGVPYPMFIEYLTEKLIKGNNTQTAEQARNEVFRILSQPRQASAFWGQFKRSVVNVSEQVERDLSLGVNNPSTPVWTHERIEPSIDEAISAGKKITAANGDTVAAIDSVRANPQLEAKLENNSSTGSSVSDPWTDSDAQPTLREMAARRKIKGFVKAMPQVSQSEAEAEARKLAKPKTNISQMSVAEINDYLTDPVLRAQLTPQLMKSDYELITDEMGRIIGVKAPPPKVE